MIFVNSMSDLFHEDVPLDVHPARVRRDAAGGLAPVPGADQARRAARWSWIRSSDWPANVWMGVSVENADVRRPDRLTCGAPARGSSSCRSSRCSGRFRSSTCDGIDWVIVGGESGPGARPMDREWVVDIRDQCRAARVPFFFKQWGGVRKTKAGRELDGRTWDEMPRTVAATT